MNLTLFTGLSCLLTIVPLHAGAVWGATPTSIGLLYSAVALPAFLGGPLGGWIADNFGRATAMLPACALLVSGSIGLALSTSQTPFIVSAVVWGLGNSILTPCLTAYTVEAAPYYLRGLAIALGRQATDVALVSGPLVLGVLADVTSMSTAILATSGFMAFCSILFAVRTRARP